MPSHPATAGRSPWATLALSLALACLAALAPTRAAHAQAPVNIRALPQYTEVEQGGKLVIAVELAHAPKHHSWPSADLKLPEAVAEVATQRTEIGPAIDDDKTSAAQDAARAAKKSEEEVDAIRVYKLPAWLRLDGVQYPELHNEKVPDPNGGTAKLEVPVYVGKAVAYLRFELAPDAPLGDQTINIRVYSQTCNEETCFPPDEKIIPVKFKVVAKGAAASATANDKPLFDKFDTKKWGPSKPAPETPKPADTTKPAPAPTPTKPAGASTDNANPASPALAASPIGATFFGFNIGASALVLALFGAIGGVILNLTPCVLPVIPIKVLSLTQHATSKAHALILGLWMAVGIVAFWTLAGVPMALFSRALDPSRFIFGVWWVTLSIGLIIALLGLGVMGLFTLSLPQSVYAVETKADSPTGSFMFGLFTAVLGLPCFGLVIGGLLAGAATLPWYAIMAVFVGLGVGMAAPYLLLSVYPQLLKFIPRTGPASELVKQVMGLLLLAGAAFFLAAGIKALVSDFPYIEGSLAWWAVAFFIAIAGLWLTLRTFQISKSTWPRVVFPILAIVAVLGVGLFTNGKFRDDRKAYLELAALLHNSGGGATGTSVPAGVWMPYTPELFASVRASGRPVFLDFTADWCINCKFFKRLLLVQNPVLARFKSTDIVLMEVDCTSTHAAGWDLLKKLGRTGVPTWVVYGPLASAEPVVIDLTTPTSQTVLDALDRAGVPKPAQASAAR